MRTMMLMAAAAAALASAPASADVLYSNNFSGGVVVGAGVTAAGPSYSEVGTALAGSWNAAGWTGSFLRNSTVSPIQTSSFTFTGLAAHNSISLGGVLGFLDSWDGNNLGGGVSPDLLEVLVDGNVIATLSSNQVQGTGNYYGGTILAPAGSQVDANQFYSDVLIDLGTTSFATFAHSSSTLNLSFRAAGAGWQGGTDESWGIDNLSLSYSPITGNAVPEPATWAMMIAGFGLVGGAMRRRASTKAVFA